MAVFLCISRGEDLRGESDCAAATAAAAAAIAAAAATEAEACAWDGDQ